LAAARQDRTLQEPEVALDSLEALVDPLEAPIDLLRAGAPTWGVEDPIGRRSRQVA
jgi:hypothetical protein